MEVLGRVTANYTTRAKITLRGLIFRDEGKILPYNNSATVRVSEKVRNRLMLLQGKLCMLCLSKGKIVFARKANLDETEMLKAVLEQKAQSAVAR